MIGNKHKLFSVCVCQENGNNELKASVKFLLISVRIYEHEHIPQMAHTTKHTRERKQAITTCTVFVLTWLRTQSTQDRSARNLTSRSWKPSRAAQHTHIHTGSLTIQPQSPLSICSVAEPRYSKSNRRLLEGYAVHLLLAPCGRKHTKQGTKHDRLLGTYKNHQRWFSDHRQALCQDSMQLYSHVSRRTYKQALPCISSSALPTALPPEHIGKHSADCSGHPRPVK